MAPAKMQKKETPQNPGIKMRCHFLPVFLDPCHSSIRLGERGREREKTQTHFLPVATNIKERERETEREKGKFELLLAVKSRDFF